MRWLRCEKYTFILHAENVGPCIFRCCTTVDSTNVARKLILSAKLVHITLTLACSVLACERAIRILFGISISHLHSFKLHDDQTFRINLYTGMYHSHIYQLQIHNRNHIRFRHDVRQGRRGETLAPGSLRLVVKLNSDKRSVRCKRYSGKRTSQHSQKF
jgi:hypothetical protein